jgi:serine/threonine protein kinase
MKLVQNEVEKKLLNQEINALRLMNSPNVISLFDSFNTVNNTYIITEYCNQGSIITISNTLGDLCKFI